MSDEKETKLSEDELGTTSIVAQWVYFMDDHDRPRSQPSSPSSQITQCLWPKLKRTLIDFDRYFDRSACTLPEMPF
jgi:hypothetical protein